MNKQHILHGKILRGVKEKSIGLLNAKKAYPVYFETRWGIHTFGMKFPIDVVILDANNSVVRMKKNLQPNTIYFWLPTYKKVLELPTGWLTQHNVTLGNTISVRESFTQTT